MKQGCKVDKKFTKYLVISYFFIKTEIKYNAEQ